MEGKAVGNKDENRRSMLEPAHFLAFPERCIASKGVRSAMLGGEQNVEEVQAYAGDEHRCHRHQHERVAGGGKRRAQHRAFVLAEKLLDAPQPDWIDCTGVPGDVTALIK